MNSKNQWRKGPIDSIICQPPHDRPVFSMACNKNNFVTGSADHGLRQYNLYSWHKLGKQKYGHKEWVSTCAYTPSGRIISGAMDSVVCFWQSKAVKCDHFLGHQASISKVMADDRLGISSSYDATIILWDLNRKQMSQKLIGPHKQAIMEFEWMNSLLVSGDKSGVIGIWDLNKCKLIKSVKTHKGSVSGIKISQKSGLITTSGLNDGVVAHFDLRTNCPVHKQMLHKGSVNGLKVVEQSGLLLSCSADGTVSVLSIPDFKQVLSISAKDMVFAVEEVGETIVVGTAKGNVLGFDLFTGQPLYGYGVMKKGGCRLLGVNQQKGRIVCGGEDESATLLLFK